MIWTINKPVYAKAQPLNYLTTKLNVVSQVLSSRWHHKTKWKGHASEYDMVKNTSTRARIITHYAIVVIDFDNQIKQADQVSRSEFEIKRLTTSCLFPHEEDYCCLRDHNCCS